MPKSKAQVRCKKCNQIIEDTTLQAHWESEHPMAWAKIQEWYAKGSPIDRKRPWIR